MQILRFQTTDLEIGFSADSGSLCLLRPRGIEENWLGHGTEQPGVDIRLADGWFGRRQLPALLDQNISGGAEQSEITITSSMGPLTLRDSYTVRGRWIRRRVTLENRGNRELQVKGLRLLIPGVRIGLAEHCLFEAPGTAVLVFASDRASRAFRAPDPASVLAAIAALAGAVAVLVLLRRVSRPSRRDGG